MPGCHAPSGCQTTYGMIDPCHPNASVSRTRLLWRNRCQQPSCRRLRRIRSISTGSARVCLTVCHRCLVARLNFRLRAKPGCTEYSVPIDTRNSTLQHSSRTPTSVRLSVATGKFTHVQSFPPLPALRQAVTHTWATCRNTPPSATEHDVQTRWSQQCCP